MSTNNTDKIEIIKVPKKRIMSMAKAVEQFSDDTPISFEYVLMALFPSVWTNIQEALKDAYTKGYIQGKEEGRNEAKGDN